jgi:hypothetical protein
MITETKPLIFSEVERIYAADRVWTNSFSGKRCFAWTLSVKYIRRAKDP